MQNVFILSLILLVAITFIFLLKYKVQLSNAFESKSQLSDMLSLNTIMTSLMEVIRSTNDFNVAIECIFSTINSTLGSKAAVLYNIQDTIHIKSLNKICQDGLCVDEIFKKGESAVIQYLLGNQVSNEEKNLSLHILNKCPDQESIISLILLEFINENNKYYITLYFVMDYPLDYESLSSYQKKVI